MNEQQRALTAYLLMRDGLADVYGRALQGDVNAAPEIKAWLNFVDALDLDAVVTVASARRWSGARENPEGIRRRIEELRMGAERFGIELQDVEPADLVPMQIRQVTAGLHSRISNLRRPHYDAIRATWFREILRDNVTRSTEVADALTIWAAEQGQAGHDVVALLHELHTLALVARIAARVLDATELAPDDAEEAVRIQVLREEALLELRAQEVRFAAGNLDTRALHVAWNTMLDREPDPLLTAREALAALINVLPLLRRDSPGLVEAMHQATAPEQPRPEPRELDYGALRGWRDFLAFPQATVPYRLAAAERLRQVADDPDEYTSTLVYTLAPMLLEHLDRAAALHLHAALSQALENREFL